MKKIIFLSIFTCIFICTTQAVQLAGGDGHSLVLKEDGTVWAWGYNNGHGQLGDGTIIDRLTPVQTVGLTDVVSISAGSSHSLALKRDGTAWAWGYNGFGQLGNGTAAGYYPPLVPYPTPALVLGLSGVLAVAGGLIHSLFLKSDGTVWACGSNRNGQLGDGTTTDRYTPVQVIGLFGVTDIAGGGEHSLALKRDGTVWAWGWNYHGQLGDGNGGPPPDYSGTNYSTVPVQVLGLSNVIAVSGGSVHSLAIKNDGTVWAWGWGEQGQLGDGNGGYGPPYYYYSTVPVQSLVSGIIAIESGGYYSLVLTSYGMVWFFGQMELGGINNFISSIIPVPVDGISDIKSIGSGNSSDHALALRNGGTLWSWGNNNYGQLGDGTTMDRSYPVQVKEFSTGGSVSVPSTVLAADFDEDGKADPTAISSSGELFYWNSSQSFSRSGPMDLGLGDLSPIALASGDVNGDGQPDLAVVSATGGWYFFLSGSNGYSLHTETFGQTGTPLLADFDGDRKADPTVVSASGLWTVWLSGAGYSPASGSFLPSTAYSLQPVSADFDADGRADPVMVTSAGGWYLWPSSELYTKRGPYDFGVTGKPVAGDFDGDGKADPGIVDSSGNWNLFLSARFYTRSGPWYLVLP